MPSLSSPLSNLRYFLVFEVISQRNLPKLAEIIRHMHILLWLNLEKIISYNLRRSTIAAVHKLSLLYLTKEWLSIDIEWRSTTYLLTL